MVLKCGSFVILLEISRHSKMFIYKQWLHFYGYLIFLKNIWTV